MARAQETFGKKEREKKRLKKRQEKDKKKEERKGNNQKGEGLDNMIAYVDEYGQTVDSMPEFIKNREEIDPESIVLGVPKKEKVFIDPIKKGKVDFFNTSKGFGFIKENDTQEKYFVHVHGLLDDIAEGDSVSFELEKGMKGMNAVRVKQYKAPAPVVVIKESGEEEVSENETPENADETPKEES